MAKTKTKPETARDTRPVRPQPVRCEGCNTLVDPLYPNCACFRG